MAPNGTVHLSGTAFGRPGSQYGSSPTFGLAPHHNSQYGSQQYDPHGGQFVPPRKKKKKKAVPPPEEKSPTINMEVTVNTGASRDTGTTSPVAPPQLEMDDRAVAEEFGEHTFSYAPKWWSWIFESFPCCVCNWIGTCPCAERHRVTVNAHEVEVKIYNAMCCKSYEEEFEMARIRKIRVIRHGCMCCARHFIHLDFIGGSDRPIGFRVRDTKQCKKKIREALAMKRANKSSAMVELL
jgi:hypothetical protein